MLSDLIAINTQSPRETLRTLLALRAALDQAVEDYHVHRDRAHSDRVTQLVQELSSLIDFSEVPHAARTHTGMTTISSLLDIIARIPLPDLADVPGIDEFDANGPAIYRLPNSQLRIVRIESGPRALEFLFGARTVQVAPRCIAP